MALTSEVFSQDRVSMLDQDRFVALWERSTIKDGACSAAEVFELLDRHYKESHRRYHSPEHIRHCLRQFDQARDLMDTPDAVELALWFHDVIYDPEAKNNELRSAELFSSKAQDCMDAGFCQLVWDLVMITVHPSTPKTPDEAFVVDIDLSSFGLPWEAFSRDSVAVREERSTLSDEEYHQAQVRFLSSLLKRSSFFVTDFFRDKCESTARTNIERYLKSAN